MVELITTILFLALIAYSIELQIIQNSVYHNAITNTTKQRKLPAPRGDIFDSNGVWLATTEYQHGPYIIPYYFHGNIKVICENVKIDCDNLLNASV